MGKNLPEGIYREFSGPINISDTVKVASPVPLWGQLPDAPLTDRQDFDPYNVWYERNGATVTQSATSYQLVTDSGQTGSEAVLENAQLGVYRPGSTAATGAGVYIDSRPTGDGYAEVRWAFDGIDDGLAHRITSDDFQGVVENRNTGTSITISRNAGEFDHGEVTEKTDADGNPVATVYGFDGLDGEGPSTVEWDPAEGYIYGFIIGWYGPSASVAFIKSVNDYNSEWTYDVIPLYMVEPYGEPLFEFPNKPLGFRVNNGTTAETVELRTLGRSYEVFADFKNQATPIWSSATGQSLPMDGTGAGDRDWYVVGVARRKPSFESSGTAVGVESFEIASTAEPTAIHARTVDPSYLSNVEYQSPVDAEPALSKVELDLAPDTTTRVGIDTFTTAQGDSIPQGVMWKGDHIGAGGQKRATEGDLSGELVFPVVRDNPTVWLARTRTGSKDTVDCNVILETVG